MSLLTGALLGVLAGIVAVILVPMIVGSLLPGRWAQPIARQYNSWTMGLYRRALLVFPENGHSPTLKMSRFDDDAGGEEVPGDKHFSDPGNRMSQWHGRPFGVADASRNVIVDCRDMDLGHERAQREDRGDMVVADRGGDEWVNLYLGIPTTPQLVNPGAAPKALDGSADPGIAQRIRTLAEISQSKFDSSQRAQQMIWLLALALGFGLMWVGSKVAQESGGGGLDGGIPLVLGAVPW